MGNDWKGEFDYLRKFCKVIIYKEQKVFPLLKLKVIYLTSGKLAE